MVAAEGFDTDRVPGTARTYVRFAALGDSATFGLGDPVGDGWRGWARLLVDAIADRHHVSFCNLAQPGATVFDVRAHQIGYAVTHAPQVASLVVGLNDTLRSTWDPGRFRDDLHFCAAPLAERGALILSLRFHDHGRVLGLPGVLSRPLVRRIEAVNAAYDEIEAQYGGLHVDLRELAEVYDRRFWSVDRMHPSERGHRVLARSFSTLLNQAGLDFEPPSTECSGAPATKLANLRWMFGEGAPWIGRRVRDLGPALAMNAYEAARARLAD